MTWKDLAAWIDKMPQQERERPVFIVYDTFISVLDVHPKGKLQKGSECLYFDPENEFGMTEADWCVETP